MENPKIRFKGFTKDWEQRRFGEITELKSASRVHKDEWTSNGVPFYRSSDVMTAINGTENEKAFISEELYEKLSKVSGKLEEGDILVTGGGSVGNPYIVPDNKPLYTKDADLLWIKNKGKFHPYFLYEFFFSPTFRNYLGSISHVGTIAHYTITQLSDTPIGLPIFEEQKEVGEYFQSLDRLITLHQRKCDQTKNLKKYMLQKMFPQNGAKVPEIRFDGYTYDWEQRKFGSLLEETRNKTIFEDEDTLLSCAIDGMYLNSELFSHFRGSSNIGYLKVKKNDLILSAQNLHLGNCNVNLRFEHGIISPAYKVYELVGCNPLFMQAWVKKDSTKDFFLKSSTEGASVCRKNIVWEELYKQELPVPSIEEQTKVGEYFYSLDHLITLHQRQHKLHLNALL